ncbi:MAG: hypothetical protein NZ772_01520 [Cyanobacteria bacterium]|nr:hypothetical protein [Cyanobacteriota bacterium]MDW8199794.1 hypothetical protein [Cyanobacteriota bacterium SKYGB_h_bin112]
MTLLRFASVTIASLARTALGLGISLSIMGIEPVDAASFRFSYTLEAGDILSGTLEGNLQGDGNTVVVSSITSPSFNNVLGPSLPVTRSFVQAFHSFGSSSAPATVSLNGLVMDILTCSNAFCLNGFAIDGGGTLFGSPIYIASTAYGTGFSEPYNPARWQLTLLTLLPPSPTPPESSPAPPESSPTPPGLVVVPPESSPTSPELKPTPPELSLIPPESSLTEPTPGAAAIPEPMTVAGVALASLGLACARRYHQARKS